MSRCTGKFFPILWISALGPPTGMSRVTYLTQSKGLLPVPTEGSTEDKERDGVSSPCSPGCRSCPIMEDTTEVLCAAHSSLSVRVAKLAEYFGLYHSKQLTLPCACAYDACLIRPEVRCALFHVQPCSQCHTLAPWGFPCLQWSRGTLMHLWVQYYSASFILLVELM